jgi:L-asparaginase
MKNILVVFTGGTIGSNVYAGTINTSQQAGFKLIALFEQFPQPEPIHFKCIAPLQLLSENLQPAVWTALMTAIEQQNLADYDGIIVTHGTDTLAFTAAALSLYFHALAKPLLLVSSNYPLEHPQANGLANFYCAVEFIRQHLQNGVFVPYTNPGQLTQVHIGSRLASSLQLSGDFISVQSKSYLTFQNGAFDYVTARLDLPGFKNLAGLKLKAEFSKRILLIKPYPGLDYSAFNLTGVDAVLHDLYHSGTACTVSDWGDNHNLLHFMQRCQQAKTQCYLAPALKTADLYASSRDLLAQPGVTMLWNMSLEAAYVKLLLAYGNFEQPALIADFMTQNLALEQLENNY